MLFMVTNRRIQNGKYGDEEQPQFKFDYLYDYMNGPQGKQLYADFNFPEIPASQITLMGISSVTYLGNEMATENVWKKLTDMVAEARKKRGKAFTRAKEEIQKELKNIYASY